MPWQEGTVTWLQPPTRGPKEGAAPARGVRVRAARASRAKWGSFMVCLRLRQGPRGDSSFALQRIACTSIGSDAQAVDALEVAGVARDQRLVLHRGKRRHHGVEGVQ